MVSARPQRLNNARSYFAQFNYPITKSEAIYWQSPTPPPNAPPLTRRAKSLDFDVRGGQKGVLFRKIRQKYSLPKWQIAKSVGDLLSRIPTILAIFVTGALSMDNCPEDDDIDIMIVTSPNTLWITRFLVVLYLSFKNLRRPPSLPEHSSPRVKDKICDNLYLSSTHLVIHDRSIYHAHEILQAKCIFDRGGIHYQFLSQNSWVKKYLPVAYSQILISSKNISSYKIQNTKYLIQVLNQISFFVQYLFMKSKMTHERVTLGSAFFHPRPS